MSFLYQILDKTTNSVELAKYADYSYFSALETVIEKLGDQKQKNEMMEVNMAQQPSLDVSIFQQEELRMRMEYEKYHPEMDRARYYETLPYKNPLVTDNLQLLLTEKSQENKDILQNLQLRILIGGLVQSYIYPADSNYISRLQKLLKMIVTDKFTYSDLKGIEVYRTPYSNIPYENRVLIVIICRESAKNRVYSILKPEFPKFPFLICAEFNTIGEVDPMISRNYRKVWQMEFNMDAASEQKLILFDDLATKPEKIFVSARSKLNDVIFNINNEVMFQTFITPGTESFSLVLKLPKNVAYAGVYIDDFYVDVKDPTSNELYGISISEIAAKSEKDLENDWYLFEINHTFTKSTAFVFATMPFASTAALYVKNCYTSSTGEVGTRQYTSIFEFNNKVDIYALDRIRMYQYDSVTKTKLKDITSTMISAVVVPVIREVDGPDGAVIYVLQIKYNEVDTQGKNVLIEFLRGSISIYQAISSGTMSTLLNSETIDYECHIVSDDTESEPVVQSSVYRLKVEGEDEPSEPVASPTLYRLKVDE